MKSATTATVRTAWVALKMMLAGTLVLGLVYTLFVTGLAQLAFPAQAQGSLIRDSAGQVIGSSLIGQSYLDEAGAPLPQYFQPRPSAGGYDTAKSGGSNLGPSSPELVAQVADRQAQIAEFNQVLGSEIPADAVTASASGLDPHISPEYARLQVARVAEARGVSAQAIQELVDAHTSSPLAGYVGQARVNVVELNASLDQIGE